MRITTAQPIVRGAFLQANKDAYRRARRSFKETFTADLYLEFTSNVVGYNINDAEMYKRADYYNMTDVEFNSAIAELIREGYLVQTSSNSYSMYRQPQNKTLAVNNERAQLYFLRLTGSGEEFYKIGVTKTAMEDRFRQFSQYNIEVLETYWMAETEAYDLEAALHKLNADRKYIPAIEFGGDSECFTNLEMESMRKAIKQFSLQSN